MYVYVCIPKCSSRSCLTWIYMYMYIYIVYMYVVHTHLTRTHTYTRSVQCQVVSTWRLSIADNALTAVGQ